MYPGVFVGIKNKAGGVWCERRRQGEIHRESLWLVEKSTVGPVCCCLFSLIYMQD